MRESVESHQPITEDIDDVPVALNELQLPVATDYHDTESQTRAQVPENFQPEAAQGSDGKSIDAPAIKTSPRNDEGCTRGVTHACARR